jgi:tRNA-specific 2-thiouridylase
VSKRRIAVAMSGGVDSSVAAALLAEQGEDVFGLMLRLWSAAPDTSNRCCSPADVANARHVAGLLQIPFYVVAAQDPFKQHVVDPFILGYTQGITPNPCIECNRHVRWGFLLQHALAMGATHLATGHYARISFTDGRYHLLRARDRGKDQSYVLYTLSQHDLQHTLFPLGAFTKEEVRSIARRFDLPVAERRDSQDLCFVSSHDYRRFLQHQGVELPPPGEIVDSLGNVIGRHEGLASFTIGQRKGIGISSREPLFVLDKDMARNRLVVGIRSELGRNEFQLSQVSWICGQPPHQPIDAHVRIRYNAPEVAARVQPLGRSAARISLRSPLPDITPGQSAVIYDDDDCLGGGIIEP